MKPVTIGLLTSASALALSASSRMPGMFALACPDVYHDHEFYGKPRALPKKITSADLKPEYALIQQKKSKLSANQRRSLVARYELLLKREADERGDV